MGTCFILLPNYIKLYIINLLVKRDYRSTFRLQFYLSTKFDEILNCYQSYILEYSLVCKEWFKYVSRSIQVITIQQLSDIYNNHYNKNNHHHHNNNNNDQFSLIKNINIDTLIIESLPSPIELDKYYNSNNNIFSNFNNLKTVIYNLKIENSNDIVNNCNFLFKHYQLHQQQLLIHPSYSSPSSSSSLSHSQSEPPITFNNKIRLNIIIDSDFDLKLLKKKLFLKKKYKAFSNNNNNNNIQYNNSNNHNHNNFNIKFPIDLFYLNILEVDNDIDYQKIINIIQLKFKPNNIIISIPTSIFYYPHINYYNLLNGQNNNNNNSNNNYRGNNDYIIMKQLESIKMIDEYIEPYSLIEVDKLPNLKSIKTPFQFYEILFHMARLNRDSILLPYEKKINQFLSNLNQQYESYSISSDSYNAYKMEENLKKCIFYESLCLGGGFFSMLREDYIIHDWLEMCNSISKCNNLKNLVISQYKYNKVSLNILLNDFNQDSMDNGNKNNYSSSDFSNSGNSYSSDSIISIRSGIYSIDSVGNGDNKVSITDYYFNPNNNIDYINSENESEELEESKEELSPLSYNQIINEFRLPDCFIQPFKSILLLNSSITKLKLCEMEGLINSDLLSALLNNKTIIELSLFNSLTINSSKYLLESVIGSSKNSTIKSLDIRGQYNYSSLLKKFILLDYQLDFINTNNSLHTLKINYTNNNYNNNNSNINNINNNNNNNYSNNKIFKNSRIVDLRLN